ncbi:serum amyloid P-component-like [Gadus chalcogrammus]|uniref:serum amyloid P-component-like n=1 Tax=Gadus chalcogrammus TaxID=1042646 RepID=UPI0024C4B9A6|nr:serum amyloid P-component-like [Gadus chalcogrammus]
MKRLLTVVLLTVCAAAPEDLIGKMFTFPQETKTDHVKLITPREEFKAITLCLRSFTNLSRNHGLFSLATPAFSNAFLIFKESASDQIEMNIRNKGISFFGEEYKLNTWQSVCTSWDGANGLVQIWIDGKPSARRYCSHGTIKGHALIMLGQEQDSYGGGFDPQQSFVGMTTDVHMWDFVLSPCEIQRFVGDLNFSPGNVINWRALEYQIVGEIIVENIQGACSCLIKKKVYNMFGQSCQA